MKLFIILLLLSFNVCAETCVLKFTPPTEREDNTPFDYSTEAQYVQVWVRGTKAKKKIYPPNTTWEWTASECPLCGQIQLTVIDTDGRESDISAPGVCPPNTPVMCQ